VICPPVEAGTPDILASVNGIFVGLEIKVGKGKPSKIQKYRMTQISSSGGIAEVVKSREELQQLLSRLEHTRLSGGLATLLKQSLDY